MQVERRPFGARPVSGRFGPVALLDVRRAQRDADLLELGAHVLEGRGRQIVVGGVDQPGPDQDVAVRGLFDGAHGLRIGGFHRPARTDAMNVIAAHDPWSSRSRAAPPSHHGGSVVARGRMRGLVPCVDLVHIPHDFRSLYAPQDPHMIKPRPEMTGNSGRSAAGRHGDVRMASLIQVAR